MASKGSCRTKGVGLLGSDSCWIQGVLSLGVSGLFVWLMFWVGVSLIGRKLL